jgi:hypothetical protein
VTENSEKFACFAAEQNIKLGVHLRLQLPRPIRPMYPGSPRGFGHDGRVRILCAFPSASRADRIRSTRQRAAGTPNTRCRRVLPASAGVLSCRQADAPASTQLYMLYIGVCLMMLIGFGYLMTFLRWYGVGSVGLTMLITGPQRLQNGFVQ